nr:VOC family protein [Mycolicibacterium komanii]CRL68921.1 glyoxalase/bleomycin resistance protein/dioxygenase [Mycolicibacterium komanii]
MTADTMRIGMYSFDCRDAATLARFWSRVLNRRVDEPSSAEFTTIGLDDGGVTWMFQGRPAPDPPTGLNRLMIDFDGGSAWSEHADRVESLGAVRVSDHAEDGLNWVVFRDPENNTFRIFSPRPE